jgi:hypothetical protein
MYGSFVNGKYKVEEPVILLSKVQERLAEACGMVQRIAKWRDGQKNSDGNVTLSLP